MEEAFRVGGSCEIFNTDQGVQFTSNSFVEVLERQEVKISMGGKGRALDNLFIERFWRSLKYEHIYLKPAESVDELHRGLEEYIYFYNHERIHQSLNYLTPAKVYDSGKIT